MIRLGGRVAALVLATLLLSGCMRVALTGQVLNRTPESHSLALRVSSEDGVIFNRTIEIPGATEGHQPSIDLGPIGTRAGTYFVEARLDGGPPETAQTSWSRENGPDVIHVTISERGLIIGFPIV